MAVVAVILDTGERIRAGVDDVRHSLPSLWDAVGAVRVRIPSASAWGTVNRSALGSAAGHRARLGALAAHSRA